MKRVIAVSGAAPSLFPEPDLHVFLNYVRTVWLELKSINPPWWNQNKETKLVEGFYSALINDARLIANGIAFGRLVLEAVLIEIAPNGLPRQKGRTDIRFGYGGGLDPDLVLEFKRLDNKPALRRAYLTDGVARFVSGQYSPECDYGIMVGLVAGSVNVEKVGLVAKISELKTAATIKAQPLTHAAYGDPSTHAPALDFDTLHNRASGCPAPQIRIGHMLLER